MADCCPRCGYRLDQGPELAPLVGELRERCHQLGIAIQVGDAIGERDLALLLGVSERTVRSWRELHATIPFRQVGRRIRYALPAVAEYLAADRR